MSAILKPQDSHVLQEHPLSQKGYWSQFDRTVIAFYKHGKDLQALYLLNHKAIKEDDWFDKVFHSFNNKSSNTVKVVTQGIFVSSLSGFRSKIRCALEVFTYDKTNLEVLYNVSERKLKVAGEISRLEFNRVEEKAKKVKVLIIDDSKVIRTLLRDSIEKQSDIEVVAEAAKPSEVFDLIKLHQPDVLTLDINMPEMNGVELIKKIGRAALPPTVVVSSLNMNEGTLVMQALENGAFDYIQKPSLDDRKEFTEQLIDKLRVAAQSSQKSKVTPMTSRTLRSLDLSTQGLIVIGASTGGTEAVKAVLRSLPASVPPILIVQHIPPVFSRAFADSLNDLCAFSVSEAKDGDSVRPGHALVAPGGMQMRLQTKGEQLSVRVTNEDKISGHAPSVDCLFQSVADEYKGKAIAMLLTGMGADGAKGLLKLKQKNVYTIAQNEETSVVFGMPKQAIKLGAAEKVLGLHDMANEIAEFFRKR